MPDANKGKLKKKHQNRNHVCSQNAFLLTFAKGFFSIMWIFICSLIGYCIKIEITAGAALNFPRDQYRVVLKIKENRKRIKKIEEKKLVNNQIQWFLLYPFFFSISFSASSSSSSLLILPLIRTHTHSQKKRTCIWRRILSFIQICGREKDKFSSANECEKSSQNAFCFWQSLLSPTRSALFF